MKDFVDEYFNQYFHNAYANFNLDKLWSPAWKVSLDNRNTTIEDYSLGANQLK